MAASSKGKVIITCAVTGSIHTPSMSPHLPVTAAEIAEAVNLALEAHGFARLVDDLITVVRDGPILRAANVGQALAAGVELEGQLRLRELQQPGSGERA